MPRPEPKCDKPPPEYVMWQQFPVEIDLHIPDGTRTMNLSEDLDDCYNQLILFVMVNSFWYYVVGQAKVTNREFDYVKSLILKMEEEDLFGDLTARSVTQACPNGYSPGSTIGNRNPCNHHFSRYPNFIQEMFSGVHHGCDTWYIRPWWMELSTTGKEPVVKTAKRFPVETKKERIRRERGTLMEFD